MRVVSGITGLEPSDGPVFLVVGVFDGLHRGHAYLLEHLVTRARALQARPAVITFDAHPDAVLLGHAPPLLLDQVERLRLLEAAGVGVTVVQHFDDALRQTPYDVFVETIRDRTAVAGILMTPDAAFGHERRGTPGALAELGERDGFAVVVVPPYELDGRSVRSTDIRESIAQGDLAAAATLLGRPYSIVGRLETDGRVTVDLPVAMPPAGRYPCLADGGSLDLIVGDGGAARVDGPVPAAGHAVRLRFI